MTLKPLSAVLLALALSGCASFNNLNSEVATFGAWPADRKPATFAFDRLPSEAASAPSERRQLLETSARGALEAAGFSATGTASEAEYLVQVGARVVGGDPWMYNAPLFWRGSWASYGWGYGRYGRYGRYGSFGGFGGYGGYGGFGGVGGGYGPGWGPGWGPGYDLASFDREVVLLIRDRRSGVVLYEARADNTGPSPDIDYLLPAMFDAAMKEFPRIDPQPRKVQTAISKG